MPASPPRPTVSASGSMSRAAAGRPSQGPGGVRVMAGPGRVDERSRARPRRHRPEPHRGLDGGRCRDRVALVPDGLEERRQQALRLGAVVPGRDRGPADPGARRMAARMVGACRTRSSASPTDAPGPAAATARRFDWRSSGRARLRRRACCPIHGRASAPCVVATWPSGGRWTPIPEAVDDRG